MLSLFGKIFARQPFGFTASWWEVLLLRDIPTVQRRMASAIGREQTPIEKSQ